MTRYFISDLHFGHDSIVKWERTRFNTVQEHDAYIADCFCKWAKKLTPQDEFWVLGDWGNTSYLYLLDMLNCHKVFVYGNHDAASDYEKFCCYFDEVYRYPIFISDKLVISHIPVAVYPDMLNVHGHLHSVYLRDDNHVSVSINDMNYSLFSEKSLSGIWAKLPKYNRRFLWEPFAADMVFKHDREDIVMNKDGLIDLPASRVIQKMNREKENR